MRSTKSLFLNLKRGSRSRRHADLKATFGSTRHELNVSTYQMAILLMFNDAPTLSYREIQEATAIPEVDLKRSLQSLALVKGKNVLCRSAGAAQQEPLSKVGDGRERERGSIGLGNGHRAPFPDHQTTEPRVQTDLIWQSQS